MPSLTLIKGDRNFSLEFEIKDADGEIVDLTEVSTLTLKAQNYQNSQDTFSIEGSVTDSTLGICKSEVTNEIVDRFGEYYAEVQIEWGSGMILTSPNIFLKIVKDLPK